MKIVAPVLAMLALLAALAARAGDCQNGDGRFYFVVAGPEAHSNLWQFAYVRGWQAAASTSYPGLHNHGRLVFNSGYFFVEDNACAYGITAPTGQVLVVVAEYVEGPNTVDQRAFYAAASFAATAEVAEIPAVIMREVPPASAVKNGVTVTISWSAVPSQPEVVGYQVVRSADGIAGWTNVGTVTTDLSVTDVPGIGTWYYAVEVAYSGTPTQQLSPHGLAAMVTVP